MLRFLTLLLTVLATSQGLRAQLLTEAPQVQVDATVERLSATEADLIVTARIAEGLHIYAQSQPKPFLATKFTVEDELAGVASVGDFTSSAEPLRHQHDKLGVELHEHQGTVRWRARIQLADSVPKQLTIRGSMFAQACEADRCFAPQTYPFSATLALGAGSASTGGGSLPTAEAETTDDGEGVASFSISQLQVESTQQRSAWSVLPLAFVAGFLLNFMPCVLPVVGLKLLSFVQQAGDDRRRIVLLNVAYTAGVLSVMMVLATLAVFAGFGWGEQFSSPAFTVTLSAIVFAFGLSFLGVWEIPLPGFVSNIGAGAKQEGYGGAFSKGMLGTLLATPCSGPFLGAALAWAVTQPSYLTYSVFTSVGLGLASPYLVIGFFPSTMRFLPKPGDWMVTFKQLMGFIMLATVVYLLSFMPVAAVVPTVLMLLGVGVAVWFAGRTPLYAPVTQQVRAWSVAGIVIACTALLSFGWLQGVMQTRFEQAAGRLLTSPRRVTNVAHVTDEREEAARIPWQNYSPELLEKLVRSGRPVFIDFTADWCLTCKANEASAIDTAEVAAALRAGGVVALKADKTESNPEADQLLRQLGNSAASIPFYAVFPADNPTEPILLDGVYASPAPFVSAIESAAAGSIGRTASHKGRENADASKMGA